MKKRINQIAALIMVAVFLLCLPMPSVAAKSVMTGTCGPELTWSLDSAGTLTISGTGAMDDCYWNASGWYPFRESIREVVIGEGVTYVGAEAFLNCINLLRVRLADTVTHIGTDAFCICQSLTEINLPEGLTRLGDGAFSFCESLTEVRLPSTLEFLGTRAFMYCHGLSSVAFTGNAPYFGRKVFDQVTTTVSYPAGNSTWTQEFLQDHGGSITWIAACPEAHTLESWNILEEATCTLRGRQMRKCALCEYTQTENIPATGHSWGAWEENQRTCGVCEAFERILTEPVISYNCNENTYSRWAAPVASGLAPREGGYERAEYVSGALVVEQYDENLEFVSGKAFTLELPLYGGVYQGEDYNFVVTGQKNPEEDNNREVIRITRYSTDWQRIDDANLYGSNTTIPFDAGSLRFARSGDMLYIRTSHEMYTSSGGLRHQANVNLSISIPDMTITHQTATVSQANAGYVSHSFNQFALIDGEDYIALDHGDAYPRSVVLFRYQDGAGARKFPNSWAEIDVLPIAETTGHYNDTGVSVGGLQASSGFYLTAGCSADQSVVSDLSSAQRNIYVTATPKDDFSEAATQIHWLTNYTDADDVFVSAPHLVKVSDDRFLLIWAEEESLRHCWLNGSGEPEGQIYQNRGYISDCPPILDGDRILWYVTVSSAPVFHQIDLSTPETVTVLSCLHSYEYIITDPTCTEDAWIVYTCKDCGHSYREFFFSALGHYWSDWQTVKEPTTREPGLQQRFCWFCEETESVELPMLEAHPGDTNGDGKVNNKDVTRLMQYLAGWDVECDETVADTNGDGKLNNKDITRLMQYLAGWDVELRKA